MAGNHLSINICKHRKMSTPLRQRIQALIIYYNCMPLGPKLLNAFIWFLGEKDVSGRKDSFNMSGNSQDSVAIQNSSNIERYGSEICKECQKRE